MFELFKSEEINQVYAYEFLQKMSLSLITIFIPIYIAQSSLGLNWAFKFLIVEAIAFMVVALPVSYIIATIGFKHGLVLSYLFYLPAIISLRIFEITPLLAIVSATVLSLGKAFHWISLHSEFAVDSQSSTRGKQTGKMLGLPRVARALAPAIGGAIMAYIGFGALVATSVFFLVLSAVPLMASKDHRDPLEYSLKDLLSRKHAILGSLFYLRGIGSATGKYIFPLYVFYILGGTFNAGVVGSLASLGSVVFAVTIGRITDKMSEVKLVVLGTVLSAFLFSARAFVETSFQAYLVSLSAGLVMMIYFIPVFSDLADMAEKEDVLEFYALREIFLAMGRVSVLLAGLYMVRFNALEALKMQFHIAAVATFAIAGYAGWLRRQK